MRSLIIHWFLLAVAIFVTTKIVPGVHVDTFQSLAIATVVLGLVNALVRPILAFFSFPLTILSLGLFYLVINGVCFGLAAHLVPGFHLDGFGAAVLGALSTSLISWVLSWFVEEDDEREARLERARKRRERARSGG